MLERCCCCLGSLTRNCANLIVGSLSDEMEDAKALKKEYYQTPSHMNVSLFLKGCTEKEVQVEWSVTKVLVVVSTPGAKERTIPIDLCASIIPAQSSYKVFPTKIELKMKKAIDSTWSTLERVKESASNSEDPSTIRSNCTSNKWDSIVRELQEEDEPMEGDAALQNFFQNIYAGADEDTRRAMNKSFMESNGTVLSTNWNEIGKGKVNPRISSDKEVKHLEQ